MILSLLPLLLIFFLLEDVIQPPAIKILKHHDYIALTTHLIMGIIPMGVIFAVISILGFNVSVENSIALFIIYVGLKLLLDRFMPAGKNLKMSFIYQAYSRMIIVTFFILSLYILGG